MARNTTVQVKDSHRYFVPVLLLEKRNSVCTTYVVHNGADVANEEEEKEEEYLERYLPTVPTLPRV